MNSKHTLTIPIKNFLSVRARTEAICTPLKTEDYVLQPIVDVSPPKWHLAHTTWFFEQFILVPFVEDYELFHQDFAFLFNSYYENVGKRVIRSNRGNLSRPTVDEIYDYRRYVTKKIQDALPSIYSDEVASILELGLNHEQQHQELLITDIKYILGHNPLFPKYGDFNEGDSELEKQEWMDIAEGIYEIGFSGNSFHFDNEEVRHKVYLQPYSISNKLVSNGEFMKFIESGGYEDSNLWHSEGWEFVKSLETKAPLYWHYVNGEWHRYSLNGFVRVVPDEALSHISYYEAFALAQWKGMRLPTEFEWEAAQEKFKWGKRWEWTESAYLPYPGYKKAEGAIGEYNGKFMVNQKVLRGASVSTSQGHSRPSYRNFFHPHLRWQFTGIRLAK